MNEKEFSAKEYVILLPHSHYQAAQNSLQSYRPHWFAGTTICTLTVASPKEEQSLLELLSEIPAISYHEAGRRRALEQNNDGGKQ